MDFGALHRMSDSSHNGARISPVWFGKPHQSEEHRYYLRRDGAGATGASNASNWSRPPDHGTSFAARIASLMWMLHRHAANGGLWVLQSSCNGPPKPAPFVT